ncbi:hypothetical protein [Acidiphilium sp. AL]|uniref:hypothetical protein n=1 Tax=Acidiphilium sp. AL TaxID=2871704 RepID=UPI0021CB695D|nr:hypothetical protein [Acidiphilium sp. AL]
MFIDVVPNGRSASAVLLRESFREGRKVHKRTIANLSQMPPELIDGLRALLAGGTVVGGPDQALEIRRSLPHGHVAAVLRMMRKLEIPRLLGRTVSRECGLIGIGGRLTTPPLPHHRAYGSVPRRFDWITLELEHRGVGDRLHRSGGCAGRLEPSGVLTCAKSPSVNRRRPLL